MPLDFKRKSNRLHLDNYRGVKFYFITICCKDQINYFNSPLLISKYIKMLVDVSQKKNFRIWIYCFMPNHLHLLLEGDEKSDLIKFIQYYKQATGFDFKQKTGGDLWQKSYYDHVLRKDEAIRGVMLYILNNPVRKGIVNHYLEYCFSGSFVINIGGL